MENLAVHVIEQKCYREDCEQWTICCIYFDHAKAQADCLERSDSAAEHGMPPYRLKSWMCIDTYNPDGEPPPHVV